MSWEKVKLGDIATFSNGINFGKDAYSSGVKLITVSDFGNLYYPDYASLNEVDEKVLRKNDYLKDGDIVFVRSNGNKELVGRCMLISNPPTPVTYSGFCIRARLNDTQLNDPHFFAYYFKSQIFRKAMSNSAVGANIQNLNQGLLSNHILSLPPLKEQKRIADILSAYDDLIENNQKQIKLLEEAAQRLYKQWFIDLRYPGHETTKIVDGLPEGWKKEKLVEIIDYEIGGGWGEDNIKEKCDQPAFVIRGTDFYGITHGEILNIPFRYHSKTNLDARALCDGDIIFEVSGGSKTEGVAKTVLIKQTLLDRLKHPVMCASFCKLIRLKNRKLSQYMYDAFFYLRKSGKTAEYDKRSASSIVNYRWKDFLNEVDILIPPNNIVEMYNGIASSAYERIINFSLSIETAKKTRDRLLPKLMNGEL